MAKFRLLITDLDNTLYDWVSFFVPAFYAMIDEAIEITGVDREHLLNEMSDIHKEVQNSEEPFALLRAKSLQVALGSEDDEILRDKLDRAFHAFNSVRKDLLHLYEGVSETLAAVHQAGIPIVGHTEARVWPALWRVNKLQIDRYFTGIFLMPQIGPRHRLEIKNEQLEALERRVAHYLPVEHRKPNPNELLEVCEKFGVRPEDAFYVGDSDVRDIHMANLAGIRSGYSVYGTRYDKSLYPRLVRVTHWGPEDFSRDAELKAAGIVPRPDIVLEAFSDLLPYAGLRPLARRAQG
jgi:phosphoglycolate phosphatase-like HAD superfamily hydrolase